MDKDNLVKIVFQLEASDLHDHATESLWARPMANGEFKIDNIPFYVYGLSDQDTVAARKIDGDFVFQRLVENGGHSTYRIFLKAATDKATFSRFWEPLKDLGCVKENGGNSVYAVDVPPDVDIYEAYRLLEAGEMAGVWIFEEGKCGHEL